MRPLEIVMVRVGIEAAGRALDVKSLSAGIVPAGEDVPFGADEFEWIAEPPTESDIHRREGRTRTAVSLDDSVEEQMIRSREEGRVLHVDKLLAVMDMQVPLKNRNHIEDV